MGSEISVYVGPTLANEDAIGLNNFHEGIFNLIGFEPVHVSTSPTTKEASPIDGVGSTNDKELKSKTAPWG